MTSGDIDVLVVGSLHLDIVVKAPSLPAIDETARGTSWNMVCGGKGGNQACWASRLGACTAMISRIGRDDFGTRLIANLKSSGVDVRGVSVDGAAGSGMSVAILQDNGDYGAVIVSGSNLALTPDAAIEALRKLGTPKLVVLQNEIDEAVNMAVAREAKARGATVILNAAPARPLPDDLGRNVDVLVVNRVEAAMLSGLPVSTVEEAVATLPDLKKLCDSVIITLGSLGLVIGARQQPPRLVEPVKVTPLSTHGAGDCFIGQLAQSLATGLTIEEACIRANRTAAAFVSGREIGKGV